MGLFSVYTAQFLWLWLLNFLKLKLDSQCRLPISEFSGYHCISRNTKDEQSIEDIIKVRYILETISGNTKDSRVQKIL